MTSSSALTRDTRQPEQVVDRPPASLPLRFRRVRLSPVGWMAVLAPGAASGFVAGLAATHGRARAGGVVAATIGGALVVLALARIVDEVRWRRSAVSIELAEPDAVLDLLQAVRAQGVQADMVRADRGTGTGPAGYALLYRARDDRRVRATLAAQRA